MGVIANRTPETRAIMQAANMCRNRAMRKLIANHADEFETIYGDEREAIGLPRKPADGKRLTVEQKIAKLEAKIAELRKQAGA